MATVTSLTEAKILSLAGMRDTVRLDETDDMNLVNADGIYSVWSNVQTPANWPEPYQGIAEVFTYNTVVIQVVALTTGTRYQRTLSGTTPIVGWEKIKAWERSSLAANRDLNSVTDPGHYPVAYTNHPNSPSANAGYLEVFSAAGVRRLQRFTTNEIETRRFERVGKATLGTWNAWQEVGTSWGKAPVSANVDLDTITSPGSYPIAYTNHPNSPSANAGFLEVLLGSGVRRVQRFTTNEITPRHFERTGKVTVGTWNNWVQTDAVETDPDASGSGSREGALRLLSMRERVGPVTVTTPAAVTIVMDHGLTNVKNKVLPLLRARGLTATLAINSQRWADANNAGATQADVRSWADVFEFANHGRTHDLTGNEAADTLEIEGGREELETQLETTIDSWIQTGNAAGSYAFDDGRSEAVYWETVTGRIVSRTHAVSTGLVPHSSRLYNMDGHPRFGAHGFWLDNGSAMISTAQARVTDAIAQGKRVILRLHPQFIDQAGYITTAQLTAFLDWLVTQRNAGRITVLTFRQWQIAQAGVRQSELVIQPGSNADPATFQATAFRVGSVVTLNITLATPLASQSSTDGNMFQPLPLGYRPRVIQRAVFQVIEGNGQPPLVHSVIVNVSGSINTYDTVAGKSLRLPGSLTFLTDDPPPVA